MNIPLYEQYLIDTVLPQLREGRADWDEPHTKKVVHYVKKIVQNNLDRGLDLDVLVVVAYLHDYGYRYFFDELKEGPTGGRPKKEHANKSAEYWITIRNNPVFDGFGQDQKDRIEHLIRVHDEIEVLDDIDELVFMEADTLGAIAMPSNVDPQSMQYRNYIARVKERRLPRFITDYSKEKAGEIFEYSSD